MRKFNYPKKGVAVFSAFLFFIFCAFHGNAQLAVTADYAFTPIACAGGLSSQSIEITGGMEPYDVVNQHGGVLITGASEGVRYNFPNSTFAAHYDYTVTDANGSTHVFSVTISDPATDITFSPIACAGGLSDITFQMIGGSGHYDVHNQNGGALITGAQAGVLYTTGQTYAADYVFTITHVETGCSWNTSSYTISDPAPDITFSTIACAGGLSDITFQMVGGSGHYNVYNQNGGALITGAEAGVFYTTGQTYAADYVFTITHVETGCSWNTPNYNIPEPTNTISADFNFTPITCVGGLSDLDITVTGGTGPYDVHNQNGGALITGAHDGVFWVTFIFWGVT